MLRPGLLPTITFAWPAANSGICLLFNASTPTNTDSVGLNFSAAPFVTVVQNGSYGLKATVIASLPPTLLSLSVNDVVLGSMRAVRDAREFASTNLTRFSVTLSDAGLLDREQENKK